MTIYNVILKRLLVFLLFESFGNSAVKIHL